VSFLSEYTLSTDIISNFVCKAHPKLKHRQIFLTEKFSLKFDRFLGFQRLNGFFQTVVTCFDSPMLPSSAHTGQNRRRVSTGWKVCTGIHDGGRR